MADRVESWPMEGYPWRNRDGDILTNFFKLEIHDADGRTAFHTYRAKTMTQDGEEREVMVEDKATGKKVPMDVAYALREFGVTTNRNLPAPGQRIDETWHGMRYRIPAVDLRTAEKEIGGKPTMVKVGLWHRYQDGEWEAMDLEKLPYPPFWADITDRYYEWRLKAYEGIRDPYASQQRPYTKMQVLRKEHEDEVKRLKAELEALKKGVANGEAN